MADITVSFLFFDGCPLAARARDNLMSALEHVRARLMIGVEEVDIMDPQTPESMQRWGSPTILVDGMDITGATQGAACNCRIYPGKGSVPTIEQIADALRQKIELRSHSALPQPE